MKLTAGLLFVSVLVAAPPTPQSHFGHPMGADRKVLDWDRTVSYFETLEKASDRIVVREYGKSTEGRPMIVAYISAPETLKNLERYRQIQKKLADPRLTPETEARKLIEEGKTVVMITCAIHSTEIAATHTAAEFAHRMLTDASPKTEAILSNVIFMLVPSLNPDGQDLVTEWYRKTLGTQYEGTSPPQLYQKYTGHDNNRDWYIFSQKETQATISQLHNMWHPQIVYDVHQQGASSSRMFVPPWMDPIDPNIDPMIAQWCNAIGMGMAADLTAAGKQGVAVNAMYDFWTPARHYQSYHGGVRILSESASAKLATPVTVRREELSENAQGYSPKRSTWNHLEVWNGGTWRVRDIVDYQLIAFESLLYQAAMRRTDLLASFYKINQRASRRMAPFSFVVPKQQADPSAAKKMLETLAFGGVETDEASDAFMASGKQYAVGDYIVRMQQPFSGFAKTLLEKQVYPDLRLYPGGPPKRPYDVTAHTLPLLMGVAVDTVPESFAASARRASSFSFRSAAAAADGLPASDIESYRAVNAAWKAGRPVYRSPSTGDFSLSAKDGMKPVSQPRVGLYRSHMPQMDEGWTRWLFDTFGWRYASVRNEEILAGGLRAKYDAIVFPEQSVASIETGYKKGAMPDEYVGGLGEPGAAQLKEFAMAGGSLIFLNDSAVYASEKLGIGPKNVLAGVSNRDFYCPGSLLTVTLKPGHPLGFGLPAQIPIWMEQSPAWESDHVVARYGAKDLLASGWLLGESHLANKSALLDIPVGSGRAILFGMRPQYRAQSYQAFKLLFNALLYR